MRESYKDRVDMRVRKMGRKHMMWESKRGRNTKIKIHSASKRQGRTPYVSMSLLNMTRNGFETGDTETDINIR